MESICIFIFVLTYLWEGFGYVFERAMTRCKPVAAFHVCSHPEIMHEQ